MLKCLAILAIAALATSAAIGVSGRPNENTNKKENKTEQQPTSLLHAVGECPTANNTTYHEAKTDTDSPKWYASIKWTELLALALTSLTLVVVGYQAWLSRDTARRQLRAYVCVSGGRITSTGSEFPEIQVEMKNGGLTPAYSMRFWIGLAIGSHPLRHTLAGPPEGFQMGVSVMPQGATEPMFAQWDRNAAPDIRFEIGTPTSTLYVYGRAEYRDAFHTQRFTEFRLIFGGHEPMRLKETDGVFSGSLKPDVEGNRAN